MAMRGYTYVGKLLPNLIKLIPIDFEDLKTFWGFENKLNQLRQSLVAITDMVEDAEVKQETMEDARQWLRNLKEVAYEVDDLLSELAYETARIQVHSSSSISRAINSIRKSIFRDEMEPRLKKVNRSLKDIQRQSLSLQLSSFKHNLEDMLSRNRFVTDSIIDNSVVGRKADVAKIVNLITSSYDNKLTGVVVPIIGIDGIGKTALAKLVCQKVMASTRKPFDVKIWVHVSNTFNEQRILGEMLRSLNASFGGLTNKVIILGLLREELFDKKFLLVLDDVRNEGLSRWDFLKTLLSCVCTKTGNAIMVTTNSMEVASIMRIPPRYIHRLNFLSNDECWLILKERAFRKVTKPVPSILEVIGREIATKCVGMPLIAKVLGGIMGFNMDEETWLKIRDAIVFKERSDLRAVFEQIFHHLPPYLKPCFVFCSVFPKDFLIKKDELIWLWMAEGIVESWDIGSQCFDALLESCIFQDVERDDYDDIIKCKMHDLVHDLALSMSRSGTSSIYHAYADDQYVPGLMTKKLRTILIGGVPNQEIWKMEMLRSLHFNASDMAVLPSSIRKMKHLRYIDVSVFETKELSPSITKLYNLQTLNLSNSSIKELPEFITKLFNLQTLNLSKSSIKELPKSIRVLQNLQTLNVSNSDIKELPESINKLHKLQTLDVSNSVIKELPESITELCNLQTLKFLKCKELTKLPRKNINNLATLKHIAFSYEHQMPFRLGKLSCLETLSFFVVGPDWGGSIEELQCLNELSGDLKITRLEEVRNMEEVERASFQRKAKIEGLCFEWSCGANDRSSRDEEILDGLHPHPNIERIKIKYYMGEKWPSWMLRIRKNPGDGDSFVVINNLVDLSLEQCWNCVQLPRLGDLPCLKFLKMSHMGKVKRISYEFYGIDSESSSIGCLRLFPVLESLSISQMENLIEWSSPSDRNKVVVFPCLENLYIQSCPKLTGFPMRDLSELVKLEIRGCEDLRLLRGRQQSVAFLTSLSIVGCSKFTYLRNWLLSDTCFMELSVRRCEWLTFIPHDFWKLSCLTSLEVYCCKRLRYFPEEILCRLARLQYLSIGAFSEELDGFGYLNGIKDLPGLDQELEIWGSDLFGRKMSSLPNQLQHLISLKSLKIIGFTKMKALPEWLKTFQFLQTLSLDYCRHLRWSPSTATVIESLSRLKQLHINCCPILEKSKSELLQSLHRTKIKVEFSHVSNVRVCLGYQVEIRRNY